MNKFRFKSLLLGTAVAAILAGSAVATERVTKTPIAYLGNISVQSISIDGTHLWSTAGQKLTQVGITGSHNIPGSGGITDGMAFVAETPILARYYGVKVPTGGQIDNELLANGESQSIMDRTAAWKEPELKTSGDKQLGLTTHVDRDQFAQLPGTAGPFTIRHKLKSVQFASKIGEFPAQRKSDESMAAGTWTSHA